MSAVNPLYRRGGIILAPNADADQVNILARKRAPTAGVPEVDGPARSATRVTSGGLLSLLPLQQPNSR